MTNYVDVCWCVDGALLVTWRRAAPAVLLPSPDETGHRYSTNLIHHKVTWCFLATSRAATSGRVAYHCEPNLGPTCCPWTHIQTQQGGHSCAPALLLISPHPYAPRNCFVLCLNLLPHPINTHQQDDVVLLGHQLVRHLTLQAAAWRSGGQVADGEAR